MCSWTQRPKQQELPSDASHDQNTRYLPASPAALLHMLIPYYNNDWYVDSLQVIPLIVFRTAVSWWTRPVSRCHQWIQMNCMALPHLTVTRHRQHPGPGSTLKTVSVPIIVYLSQLMWLLYLHSDRSRRTPSWWTYHTAALWPSYLRTKMLGRVPSVSVPQLDEGSSW